MSASNGSAFPPTLYLIGAQKAGTTTLAYLLNQHPDIALSDPKEPDFFAANFDKGWDWYRRCFPAAAPPVLLDASTGYTMATIAEGADDTVPRRIAEHAPGARFIYVLRDPVDRAVSAYWHDARAGISYGEFRQAIQSWPFYSDVSRYRAQVDLFLQHFPRERFLFVDFRELSQDPLTVADRCLRFAGLDPNAGTLHEEPPRNTSFQFNSVGRVFFNLFPSERAASQFVAAVKAITPGFVHSFAKSAMTRATDEIDAADRAWLAERFAEENKAMEELTGFRFYN